MVRLMTSNAQLNRWSEPLWSASTHLFLVARGGLERPAFDHGPRRRSAKLVFTGKDRFGAKAVSVLRPCYP